MRKTRPAWQAGRINALGGKLLPGEGALDAARREVREELGCTVRIDRVLPGAVPIDAGRELRVVLATLEWGRPEATEHDALRWLAADELRSVPWPRADLPFLDALAEALRTPPPTLAR